MSHRTNKDQTTKYFHSKLTDENNAIPTSLAQNAKPVIINIIN